MKTYLALGDSYTIGEQVAPLENFPNQTIELLNKTQPGSTNTIGKEGNYDKPRIIATTGWTTDELAAAIDQANIAATFDIVSLLIGVNNQYSGRSIKNFEVEFEHLVQRAIQFANNKPDYVFVLSIPDWGVTPFAEGRDRIKIAEEIDAYNVVCQSAAKKFNTAYLDITTLQRVDGMKEDFLAPDKLHPSGKEYSKWAIKLARVIKEHTE